MGFFLARTWLWWLLSALVATVATWLLLRWQDSRAAATRAGDGGAASGHSTDGHPPSGHASGGASRSVPTPSRGLSLRGGLAAGDPDTAAMRAEIEALRLRADDVEHLRTRLVTLKVDADRTVGLEEEVRLLRLRLEGEDGQVAVLKRRIALLEAEASRVPDLERELARTGHSTAARTLGQVVQQAAGVTVIPAPAVIDVTAHRSAHSGDPAAPATPDVEAGRRALGVPIVLDDLKLVEGIGPKIESLLQGAGLGTWAGLAQASVERLQGVLAAAGPRYQLHDPQSWPQQAALLDRGDWSGFVELTGRLKAGRA